MDPDYPALDTPGLIWHPSLGTYAKWLYCQKRLTPAVEEALEKARDLRRLKPSSVIVYVVGALTEASAEDKERYTRVSQILREVGMFGYVPHLHGTDPAAHPDISPPEVRDIDYLWAVIMPDFHANFLHPVAHGNGVEAGWAEVFGIPAVFCAPRSMRISRLPRGLFNIDLPVLYDELDQCYTELEALFKAIGPWQALNPEKKVKHFFAERKIARGEVVSHAEARIHYVD